MDIIRTFFRIIGSVVCHQLPERTLLVGGAPLPFCARDTGIYLGFFLGWMYLGIKNKHKADAPPGLGLTAVLCLLMLPMLIDGGTSYLGLRNTTNEIRLFTGTFFGMSLPYVLIPAANFKIYARNENRVIDHLSDLVLPLASALVICLVILKTQLLPWILVAGICTGSFVFCVYRIVYTVTVRVVHGRLKKIRIMAAGITILILGLMYLISSLILQPLKNILLKI
ncbi:MAG: DUF2085 domain-containing protein [Clostridia bacterium]|nr:DUF2085 domain-containing protein [Clostridia bacterium]